jgi:Flp pilus assembly protein TadG
MRNGPRMSNKRFTPIFNRLKGFKTSQQPARRSRKSEAGVSAILTAIVATTLLGSVSFAVDMGNAMQVQRRAQNAADAASFAGLERYQGKLSEGATLDQAKAEAVVEAQRYANKNFTNIKWETCSADKPAGFKDLSGLVTPIGARAFPSGQTPKTLCRYRW